MHAGARRSPATVHAVSLSVGRAASQCSGRLSVVGWELTTLVFILRVGESSVSEYGGLRCLTQLFPREAPCASEDTQLPRAAHSTHTV